MVQIGTALKKSDMLHGTNFILKKGGMLHRNNFIFYFIYL